MGGGRYERGSGRGGEGQEGAGCGGGGSGWRGLEGGGCGQGIGVWRGIGMEGVGRWRVHVDGGREEVGARRGAVEGWPGCMGEGGGVGGD